MTENSKTLKQWKLELYKVKFIIYIDLVRNTIRIVSKINILYSYNNNKLILRFYSQLHINCLTRVFGTADT